MSEVTREEFEEVKKEIERVSNELKKTKEIVFSVFTLIKSSGGIKEWQALIISEIDQIFSTH